jgi:uncharacterized repeat protein (TIGR03803 family)
MFTPTLPSCDSWANHDCRAVLKRKCPLSFLGMLLLSQWSAHIEPVEAQTFRAIYSFPGTYPWSDPYYGSFDTNLTGAGPRCTLFLSQNFLYGTAEIGGTSGTGTIFKLDTDGSGFTNLHNFAEAVDIEPRNSDGAWPIAGLTLSGDTLYGAAFQGGAHTTGTIFSLATNGDSFRTLYSFSTINPGFVNADGAQPAAELTVSGNVVYGSTYFGGPAGVGTLFNLNTDGSGFDSWSTVGGGIATLVLSNHVLYGPTPGGGSSNNGTVFRLNPDWTGSTTLYSFSGGSDGAVPRAGLLLFDNVLYGTTTAGGNGGLGTVFKLNIDGTGFATLHSFADEEGTPNRGTLVLLGHNLFGITAIFPQRGVLYSLSTNGTGFTILHTFSGPGDINGSNPLGGLAASGYTLYGTTSIGGSAGTGTIFSLSLQPQLSVFPSGQNVVVTWPTSYVGVDYGGFVLESTTNLSGAWATPLPAPVVVNGQYTVTNPIAGSQQFFRLSQ